MKLRILVTLFTLFLSNPDAQAEFNSCPKMPVATATANNWVSAITASGATTLSQPAYSNLSDFSSLTQSQLVVGNAGHVPSTLAAGSQYQVLTMGASNPGYGQVNLAQSAAVTGVLPNANTTATNANTVSTIVARDGSGNFTAGTITAALTGTASGNTTYSANNHGVVLSGSANTMTVIAPDSSTTKVLTSGGASADPTWGNISTSSFGTQTAATFLAGPTSGSAANPTFRALQAPTIQKFTANPTGATNYAFTITSGNTASTGAIYTNNAQSCTLLTALLVGDTILYTSCTGTPAASGTLTYSSGTHTGGNITFSAFLGAYVLPAGVLYLEVEGIGGGGSGAGSNTGGGESDGNAGTATTFGTSLITLNGGGGGLYAGGGGGTATCTGLSGDCFSGGPGQSGASQSTTAGYIQGGAGASSPFGSGGPAGAGNQDGNSGVANTGVGGGGGGGVTGFSMQTAGGGGAGGYANVVIPSPNSFYSYSIGAAGAAKTGTGKTGAAGTAGYLKIKERYQ